ncbi:ParB/RepB/Spo0J family partition protein [Buchananella hordeovulneris]|uniref:ParB-like N-terminal domain-containing protein n=1 Tax=Buchananella hordeovulneris TaxID=52770 RepID=A0A1Q5PUZ3_9ACTO|nr:ParB/RepB/Spo0J family partition protein [Buchananella hordeovulneris]OKL51240.1 hypothetical protein BSZ40_07960 [Buchananella hordeovulneris]
MAERRKSLGRGLGALIREDEDAVVDGSAGARSARPVDLYFGAAEGERAGRSDVSSLLSPGRARAGKRGAKAEGTKPTATRKATAKDKLTKRKVVAEVEEPVAGVYVSRAADARASLVEKPVDEGVDNAGVAQKTAEYQVAAGEPPVDNAGAAADEVARAAASETGADPAAELVPTAGVRLALLSPTVIVPNAKQPRQVFDTEEVEELAASITEVGLLQPIVVRPLAADDERRHAGRLVGHDPDSDDGERIAGEYELIMGERRLRAAQLAGLTEVPAIVRETADEDMLRDALLENLHRVNLNPLEEAAAYEQLLVEFGCTQEELARKIARSRPQISNTIRLLKLPGSVQRRVAAGVISAGHARALLSLTDGAAMERLAQRIVAENLSVRAVEELVALGEEAQQPELRRRPRVGAFDAAFASLAGSLADRFDTRVKVTMGARKGKISIDFAGLDDLDRILAVLSPGMRLERESDGEAPEVVG